MPIRKTQLSQSTESRDISLTVNLVILVILGAMGSMYFSLIIIFNKEITLSTSV